MLSLPLFGLVQSATGNPTLLKNEHPPLVLAKQYFYLPQEYHLVIAYHHRQAPPNYTSGSAEYPQWMIAPPHRN